MLRSLRFPGLAEDLADEVGLYEVLDLAIDEVADAVDEQKPESSEAPDEWQVELVKDLPGETYGRPAALGRAWTGGPSLPALSQTISTISSYDLRSALTNS